VVLDGIDLDVYRGEMLALVGRNGCGKSTLLRILCGIMRPTAGTVETKGRLAPLLALGAGFHADFSGRENARLNASLIGLTDAEIDAKMPSILEFADIGDAIDDSVSTYSSGMFARLAFAVAVASDPDVLIADEILAVGDAAFARKCYARIEELRARGTTILLVTHNAGTVLELCDRAVLLEQGRILEQGIPRDVMRRYNALLFAEGGAGRAPAVEAAVEAASEAAGTTGASRDDHYDPSLEVKDPIEYPPSGARIVSVVFHDAAGRRVNRMRLGGEYVAEFRAEFERDAEGVILGIQLRNAAGVTLAGFLSRDGAEGLSARRGEKLTMRIPFRMLLLPGRYFVTAGIRSRLEEQSMHKLVDAIAIEVVSESINVHQGYCALATAPATIERS
jgi:lipopolysaccharide transport system ATP-binding protein